MAEQNKKADEFSLEEDDLFEDFELVSASRIPLSSQSLKAVRDASVHGRQNYDLDGSLRLLRWTILCWHTGCDLQCCA